VVARAAAAGENIGDTPTHVVFVGLKEPGFDAGVAVLGPSSG
jgi:hypothetical protein